MPAGPPPEEEDSDDDDIPMPEGPPPTNLSSNPGLFFLDSPTNNDQPYGQRCLLCHRQVAILLLFPSPFPVPLAFPHLYR